MKKEFWVALIFALATGSVNAVAQTNLVVLHSFANSTADGSLPEGQPVLVGPTLYGVTFSGGSSALGAIFRMDTNGSNPGLVYSFEGGLNGANPFGTPVCDGTTFYGMTFNGGIGDGGVLYRVRTNGSNYAVLHTFAGGNADGVFPYGSLVLNGSTLYGMTASGGTNNAGVLFKIDTNATGFAVLHSFQGNAADGLFPNEGVTWGGTNLYGTTFFGGSNNLGIVFSTATNGSDFKVLHHFGSGAADGENPSGPLTLNGSTLYGITTAGGTMTAGTVFKIKTDGTGYARLHDFVGGASDGALPQFGPLLVTNGLLYGVTENGGPTNRGVLFQMSTNGTAYSILHSFGGGTNDGALPFYPPILSGANLYGLALGGGSNDLGVVYGPDTPSTPSNPPPGQVCVTVPAAASGGVFVTNVVAGEAYAYIATGCARVNSAGTGWDDPDGNEHSDSNCVNFTTRWIGGAGFVCPGLVSHSLVGKINGGECIHLGSSGIFVAQTSGALRFYLNDDNYGDNGGSWDVCITPTQLVWVCATVPGTTPAGVTITSVTAGHNYLFQSSGSIAFNTDGCFSNPDGNMMTSLCAPVIAGPGVGFVCEGLQAVSLVGKINGGQCIQLGTSGSFVALASGPLKLYYNDSNFGDNNGTFTACITDLGQTWICTNVPAIASTGVSFGTVIAGNIYAFSATGTASYDCPGNLYVDANGMPYGAAFTNVPGFSCAGSFPLSLVGSVNGTCVQLGTRGTFVAPSTGELRLFMNDNPAGYGNNCGQWDVCLGPIGDFRITAINRAANNINITWNTTGGQTNRVQVTQGDAQGNYQTNNFANLSGLIVIPGTGATTTNYTELGGATNKPSRYYRIRLVP